jgi:hypothetical protein
MGAEQQLEESTEEEQVREALNAHWHSWTLRLLLYGLP